LSLGRFTAVTGGNGLRFTPAFGVGPVGQTDFLAFVGAISSSPLVAPFSGRDHCTDARGG
jgi:hypothetical protein